jgi:hypothetical protein
MVELVVAVEMILLFTQGELVDQLIIINLQKFQLSVLEMERMVGTVGIIICLLRAIQVQVEV